MPRQTKLNEILESILGSENVYFQPPTNTTLKYPAIVYSRGGINDSVVFANNNIYRRLWAYNITIISKSPKESAVTKIEEHRFDTGFARFERHFTKDNLHHTVYRLYY